MGDTGDMNKWYKLFLALEGTLQLSCLSVFLKSTFIFLFFLKDLLPYWPEQIPAELFYILCWCWPVHLMTWVWWLCSAHPSVSHSRTVSENIHLHLSLPSPWRRQPIGRTWKKQKTHLGFWHSDTTIRVLLMSSLHLRKVGYINPHTPQ